MALFARLPYPADEKVLEQNFQNVVYIVFMLLGQFVETEVHSARGRADCIVETEDFVYIFEFKRDGQLNGSPETNPGSWLCPPLCGGSAEAPSNQSENH